MPPLEAVINSFGDAARGVSDFSFSGEDVMTASTIFVADEGERPASCITAMGSRVPA